MASDLIIKDTQLQEIVAQVRQELETLASSVNLGLAKSEGEAETKQEKPKAHKEEQVGDEKGNGEDLIKEDEMEKAAGAPPLQEDDAPPAPEAADESADAVVKDPTDDSAMEMEQPLTPEALAEEYKQLAPEELQLHLQAIKMAMMGHVEEEAAEEGQPVQEEAAEHGMDMGKAEESDTSSEEAEAKKEGEGKKVSMDKSEKDLQIETLKKSSASLEAELTQQKQKLAKAEADIEKLVALMAAPLRKSIKEISQIDYVPRTGKEEVTLSKAEVTEKLRVAVRDPSLKKSDRDLVDAYYSGEIGLDKIKHLLGVK